MAHVEGLEFIPRVATAKLYSDFVNDYDKLADYFFGAPASLDKYLEMTHDPYLRLVKREPMYEALIEYNEGLGAPQETLDHIQELRRDGNFVVLAWQHPYLLGGPLETYLKVLTAVLLCKRLNETEQGNFIPVMWVETGFDDLEEINNVCFPRGAALRNESLPLESGRRPARDVPTGEAYDELVARVEGMLPEADHKAALLQALRASRGNNMGEQFGRLMLEIFGRHGLVVASPHIFATRMGELISRAIENAERVEELLLDSKKRLEESGYTCDSVWEAPLDLYRLSAGQRHRLRYADGMYTDELTGESMTPGSVAIELKRSPEAFTTGVMLSPLAQDYCLPCVAHIAGPGGIAFLGLQKSLFDTLYVAYPQVCPQISATFVDGNCEQALASVSKTVIDVLTPTVSGEEEVLPPDHQGQVKLLVSRVSEAIAAYRSRRRDKAQVFIEASREAQATIAEALRSLPSDQVLSEQLEAAMNAYEQFGAKVGDLSASVHGRLEQLRHTLSGAMPEALRPAALDEAVARTHEAAGALVVAAESDEPDALRQLASSIVGELDRVAYAALEASEQEAAEAVTSEEAMMNVLVPKGGLQEDTVSFLYFINQRGPELFDKAVDQLDPFDFRHQVLYLDRKVV